MSEETTDYVALPELPEGAIVTEGVIVVSYMRPDSTSAFKVAVIGEALSSTYIGLLEMAKHNMFHADQE